MTTPFEMALESELTVEWQRFANKWLFPWFAMQRGEASGRVEDFRGGTIFRGGVLFEGQGQTIYWQAIGRYLDQRVHAVIQEWDGKTKEYPPEMRMSALAGTEVLLRRFVVQIINHATTTDRALRGRGFPDDVPAHDSSGVREATLSKIAQLAESHRRLMGAVPSQVAIITAKLESAKLSRRARLEKWHSENKALVWIIGLMLGIPSLIGAIAGLARLF